MGRKTSNQQKQYKDKLLQVSRQSDAGISYQVHYLTITRRDPLPTYSNLAEAGTKTVRSTLIKEIRQIKLSQKEQPDSGSSISVNCSMPMLLSEAAVSKGGNSPF